MNKLRSLALSAGVALAATVTLSSAANAGLITVTNPSFETLPAGGLPVGCGAGCSYSVDSIPGWVNSGSSGQFQPGPPTTTAYFTTLSDGPTSAFSNGGDILQTVAATVAAGLIYTLLVDIGNRNDTLMTGSAFLLVNGIYNGGAFVGHPFPSDGNWGTETIVYTGLVADVGDSITIALRSSGVQGNFDNVRLSDNARLARVPEPATLALFGAGLLGLGALRRRKSKA